MKRILITGKDSYIGTRTKDYLQQYPQDYYVEELNVKEDSWKEFDFTNFDVVFHVAGIAHMKEVKENELLYYKVNRDLTIEIAKKAKESNIKQFIFLSSMSVYGLNHSAEVITKESICVPKTFYGESKYQAEQGINKLMSKKFKICILRPPMVYGQESPGNLSKLFKAVKKIHIFPTVRNQRSSITIVNLCEYIKSCIDLEESGLLLPQNKNYMCTYEEVKNEMDKDGVKVLYLSFFNPFIRLLIGKIRLITKCFGDLKYEK